jgi:hypothetical protein
MPSPTPAAAGGALKSRLFVNGIQKDAIDAGLDSFMHISYVRLAFETFLTNRKKIYWQNDDAIIDSRTTMAQIQISKLSNRTGSKNITVTFGVDRVRHGSWNGQQAHRVPASASPSCHRQAAKGLVDQIVAAISAWWRRASCASAPRCLQSAVCQV